MDTEILIQKCQKGDRRAEKIFYDKFVDLLFAVVRRYTANNDEAQNILLKAFLKIFTALPDFMYINEASLVGWLKKIVINEALMEKRKELRTLFKVENIDDVPLQAEVMEAEPEDEELLEAVNNLPDGYKTVFLMFVVDGFSHREIAQALEIGESTSRSQYFKARKILQKQLGNSYGRAFGS